MKQLKVVVKIQGGLGNQFFTYAFGQALLKKLGEGVDLYYDIKSYETFYMPFVLEKFNIENFRIADENVLQRKPNNLYNKIIRKIDTKYNPLKHMNYYRAKGNRYDPNVFAIKTDTYFDGYWESEKYFEEIKSELSRQFTLKQEISSESLEFQNRINGSENAVAIHIRRGDKAFMKYFNEILGTDSIGYYEKAVALIESKIKKPSYFVFSDDIPWVKRNMKLKGNVCYIDKKIDDEEEFLLMVQCPNKIIASSSYSWWAAILGEVRGSSNIIISPDRYANTLDVEPAPERWITLTR